MTVKRNAMAFNHARKLTEEGRIVLDDRDEWSEHRPSAADENAYLEEHGFHEYAKWYLGGKLQDYEYPTAKVEEALRSVPKI